MSPSLRTAAAVAGLVISSLLVSCAGPRDERDSSGDWSVRTADGTTVSMDRRPERLVMDSSSAATLIPMGIDPVGIWSGSALTDDPLLDGLDLEGVSQVGSSYGQIDLERVASLEPDAFVVGLYPTDGRLAGIDPGDDETRTRLERLAPFVTVEVGGSAVATLERYEDLAGRLGAEPGPALERERAAFDDSRKRFEQVVRDHPDVEVLPVSPSPDGLSVGVADDFGELIDCQRWGLDLPGPDSGDFFEVLSWENADRYPADVLYVDARVDSAPSALGSGGRIWAELPAVRAGRTVPWNVDSYVSWERYAGYLDALSDAIAAVPASG